jgi:hypothetical protein
MGALVPGGSDKAAAGDTSAVLPEVSSQSPLTIGGIAAAPARPTPSATPSTPASAQATTPGTTPATTPVKVVPKPAAQKSMAPPPLLAAPPTEPPAEVERREHTRAARGPMKFEIEAVSETHVILVCDGAEVLNRILEAGESERARCESVVRVSAADAGAVRVSVNGHACLPLGDPGTRAFGYTIRIDDHARICPPPDREN